MNGERFICTVCSYVYDSNVGDKSNNVAPGTNFSDLPSDWLCPTCAAGKDHFDPID